MRTAVVLRWHFLIFHAFQLSLIADRPVHCRAGETLVVRFAPAHRAATMNLVLTVLMEVVIPRMIRTKAVADPLLTDSLMPVQPPTFCRNTHIPTPSYLFDVPSTGRRTADSCLIQCNLSTDEALADGLADTLP